MPKSAIFARPESCGELPRDPVGRRVGKGLAAGEAVLECSPGQVLEHHVRSPAGFAVVVDLRDVRVIECRGRPRFSLEARAVGVGSEELDRDTPP